MPRLSPIHYIAPSAISIVPNANGSYNDIAVYVTRGAKIKVFSPRAGIDMSDNAYQEWNFSGRNRRLADSTVPYTIYARLDRKNRADGYLIFAPQKLVDNEWVDKYPSVTQNGLTKNFYERTTAITKYWFVRLGEVSLPENGQRILTFDTGILDTDDFNTNWSLSPDALPLRVELGCTISDEDAGPTPYIYWGQFLVLSSHLVEGWTGTDIERFDHWEITRNTDDAVADAAWNTGERARTIRDTGVISLRHLRTVDDFNGAVSAIFTITAMERHENPEDPSNPIYAPLVSASINIHAETVEKYELVPSTTIVSYNPQSGAYNPADGVFVRVRATDQSGYVCELTNGQLVNSRITVQYAVADTENWIDVTFGDVPTDTAVGNIPTSVFSAQKNVAIRILGIDASELTSLPISFVRDGEDSKEREWIFFRSVNPVVFVDEPGLHQKPALVNGGEVNPTGAATGEDTNKNQDGWVPENWWDEMQGTDEEHPYEYGSYRDFVRDDNNGNHWGSFSDPKIWSRYAGDAVTYDIVPSVSIINADAAGTIISDGIIVRAYKTKGKERSGNILPPTVGSNYFAEYSVDGGEWTRCAMFDYQPEGEQAVHVYGIAPEYVEQAGVNIALRLKSSDDVSEVLKEVSPIEVVRIVSEEETQAIVEQYGDAHYFRKNQPDVDPHLATFGDVHVAAGLPNGDGSTSEGNLEVDGSANIGGTLDVDGKFTANDVAEIKKMLTLLEGVKSDDYVDDDPVGKGGWMITNKDEHGNSYMVIDKLFVRLKAIFNELETRKLSYAGGNIILSHAGSKVIRVSKIYEGGIEYQDYIIELDDATWHDRGIYISDLAGAEYDENNRCVILPNAHLVPNPVPPPPESSVIAYRCYLLKDDGTTATENWWRVDDQAKCQTFNIVEPGTYQNAENTYYWRLVTGIGTKVLEDGMTYDYIDLSKDDRDNATTDIPKEGDELVQQGNRTDTERQGFLALEVTGEYAPALMLYKGVNGYSLNGKRKIIISPKLTEFIVNKWVQETDYGVFPQTKERGDWSDITPDEQGNRKCYYYDLLQHNGASWLCITGDEYTTDEPSENSVAWRAYAQKGAKGDKGDKGDSITKKSEVTEYVLSTDGVNPKSGETWSTTKPTPAQGEYVLTRTTITWSDDTTTVLNSAERNPNDGVSGQDIIVDGSTVMKYCCTQSNTTHPAEDSTEWKTLDQVTQRQGWWLWSQATTFYRKSSSSEGSHDAGKSVSYNVNYIAEDGDTPEAARGISSITEYYKATNSNTPLPAPSSDTGWDTDPNLSHLQDKWDADHIYLWNYEKVTYSKAPLVERTIPQILAIWTKDGETGRGIDSITNKYKVTATSVAPAREHEGGTGWSNTPVAPAKGEYLWNYEIISWTKGTTPTYTDVQQIGYAGTDGSSITKSSEIPYYIKNTTGVRPAENDPNWNTTKPTVGKGEWLFTKTVITWSDNSTTILYTDERNPNDGVPGQDIVAGETTIKYAVADNNTTQPSTWYDYAEIVSQIMPGKWLWMKSTTPYYKGSTSGASAGSSTNYTVSYIGTNGENGRALTASSEHYNVSNSSSTQWNVPSSGTWAGEWTTDPNVPNQQGQTQWGENNRYLWNYEKVTYTESDGTTTIARTTPKVIAIWTKDGAEGRGIDSITNMYAIGDNPLTPPASGWDDEPMAPTSENPFLWNYEIISWTKGTPATTETTKHVIGRFGSDSASLYIETPNIYIPVDKDGKVSTADGQPFVARVPFYAIAGSRALAHYSAELDEDGTVDYCTFGGQGAYDPTDNIFKRTGDEVSIEGAYVDGRGIVLPNSIVFAPSDVIITIPNNSVLDEHSAYVTLTALDSQGGQYTVFGAIEMRGRVLAKTPDEPMQAFQWNGSATVAPSPLPSGANLGNWSASAPNRPAGEKYLWMTQTVRHTAYNGDVTYDNWSQATRISGDKGTPGEDASDTEWIYTRNDTGVTPDTPTSPTQAGWTDHPQGVTSSLKYEYASFRRKPAGNNQQWGAFQPPILWSHYGRNGIDGDGVEYVYARTKDATAPAVPQSGTYSEENNNYDVDEHLPYVRVLLSKDISGSTTPVTSGAYKYAKCTDDPVGVDDTWKYEWVLKRSKTSPDASGNRNWEPYSGDSVNHKMSEWANYAEKGDKGDDAVNVIVTPASLIVNQDMETLTNLSNLTETFVVQVKIGETSQTVNNIFFKSEQNESNYYKLQFLKNGGTSGGEGTINGSTLTLKAVNTYEKDGEDYYYDHAYADLVITYNTNKTINARINVYANLLGGWAHKLQGDLQEDIATMKFYFKDENGNVVAYETIGDYIKSSTENVTTLQQKTDGTITAMSELAQTANSVSMKVYEGVLPKDLFSHSASVQDYSITSNYESLPVITNTTQFKTFTASLPMTHRVKNRTGEVLTDGTFRFRVLKNGESDYCFLAVIRLENGKVASESYSPATTFNGKVKASFTVVDTYTIGGQGDNVNGTYVRGVLSFEASIDDGFTNLDFQVRRDTSTAIATILKERTLVASLSIKDGLKATGVDIEKGKITMTADQFECQNNSGVKTAWLDDMGNFTIRGVYNNLITVINDQNWDKYIIKDQSGRYSHWYLDVLLCGSFIVIESLPADVISEFNAADDGILHLPYYANDNYYSRGYTRYLAGSDSEPRLMTADELRMLAERKFVIKWNAFSGIANNRSLGPIYRPEVYYGVGGATLSNLDNRLRDLYAGEKHCISINSSVNRSPVLNVPRTFFMSFNLVKFHASQSEVNYSWGYIWMADDDSGAAAKDDINWT